MRLGEIALKSLCGLAAWAVTVLPVSAQSVPDAAAVPPIPPAVPPSMVQPAPAPDSLASFFRPISPLLEMDADFMRHRDPAEWAGLAVSETRFVENGFAWHFFRITNSEKPGGYLWTVLHDDENAAFSVALEGVRTHGGVAMIVDTTPYVETSAARYSMSIDQSRRLDPNRNFTAASPRFAYNFLAIADVEKRLVISVHTNARGYGGAENNCGEPGNGGSGNVSIRICNPVFQPFPSAAQAFPFNDDDTMAMVPVRPFTGLSTCGKMLREADFNLVAENVWSTDGSLSNYLMLRNPAVRYVTLEAPHEIPGNGDTQARLKAMAEAVITRCP